MTGIFRPDLLENRHALITGGGSGLGLAMARRFRELGARVTICGRSRERLDEAAKQLEAEEGEPVFRLAVDVRDPDEVRDAMDRIRKEAGSLDAVVNNAAGNFLAPTEELSPNGFDAVVRTVLHGTFHVSAEAARSWIQAERPGNILNILTTYAWTGSAFVIPSAAAKAGVLAMTRSLAVEWAEYGIRVNGMAPGAFPTEGAWERLLPTEEMEEEARSRVPLGRFGDVSELADMAAYLISDGSGYMTGECVTLDGGAWLASGGLFNRLTRQPREEVKEFLESLKPKR